MKRSRKYENSIPGSGYRELNEIDKTRNASRTKNRPPRIDLVDAPWTPPDVRSRKTLRKIAGKLALPKIAPEAPG